MYAASSAAEKSWPRAARCASFPKGSVIPTRSCAGSTPAPARIALDYVAKDGNPGGLRLIPVGLLYSAKDQFRSGVWLRFGPPIDVGHWTAAHPDAHAQELTAEICRRVQAMTLNYETRRESALLELGGQHRGHRGRHARASR